MNIQNFDLNLLLALDALLKEQHVTRAAMRIGLSQPAMSNALARLRDLLDDPLLVRAAKGMVPTPRAERLREPVRAALRAIERAVSDEDAFVPATTQASLDLTTSDAIGMLLLPRLGERLRKEAPGISLHVHAMNEEEGPWEGLESGRIDLVAGVYDSPPAGVRDLPLYEERFVCVMRAGHPLAGKPLSLRQYVELPHILVLTSRSGLGPSLVDRSLEQRGLTRRIALTLPHFLLAPFIVAQSDFVILFPSRLAAHFAALLPVRIAAPPLPLPSYTIRLYWHERAHRDPANGWMRGLVQEAVQDFGSRQDETPGADVPAGPTPERRDAG